MSASEEHLKTSAGKPRLGALDSLRGLASLAVLMGHTLAVCQWDSSFSRWLLVNNLFDGRSAVAMFFVLSGFVLTHGHFDETRRPMTVIPFYARRITRIWLPWFAFFVVSLVAQACFSPPPSEIFPPLTDHHLSIWSQGNTLSDYLKQLVFQLHEPKQLLLPQDWSLGVEMRASVLIPFFLLIGRKGWPGLVGVALLCLWLKPTGGSYYTSFAIGVLAAWLFAKTAGTAMGAAWFMGGLLLYQFRWVCDFTDVFPGAVAEREIWLVSSVGCVFMVLGALRCGRIRRVLESPVLAHLGRVSYSLYLVQVIILVCLAPWLVYGLNRLGVESAQWIQFAVLLTVVAICLALADLGERWIEVPCIRLGKTVTRKLERSQMVRRLRV